MPEANKLVVKGLLEGLYGRGGDPAAAMGKYRAPQCISHNLAGHPITSESEFKAFATLMRERFASTDIRIVQLVAEGDHVAYRGAFDGVTREGKSFTIEGFGICRVEDGKVVETWNGWSPDAFAAQLNGSPPATLESVLRAR